MSVDRPGCLSCGARESGEDEEATRFLSLPAGVSVRRCSVCGLRWLSPPRSRAEHEELYRCRYFEELPEEYDAVTRRRIEEYRDRLRALRRALGPGQHRLLDVGAATGEFVKEAREAGFEARGLEPSNAARAAAKARHGLDLLGGDLLTAQLAADAYDVVHMNHVLEHLFDPVAALVTVRNSLRPGGVLVVEVPYQFGNLAQLVSWAMTGIQPIRFSVYSLHHAFFFDPQSLRRVLWRAGFSRSRIRVWRPHLRRVLREARGYCQVPGLRILEQWLRLAHLLVCQRGENVVLEAIAWRP